MCELACQIVQKNLEEKQIEEEKAAKAQSWKLPVCYDDDDDEESSNSLEDNIIYELPSYSTVTPSEPVYSLMTSSLLLSSGSEDTIFDPGISNYHFSSFKPDLSHRCGTFKKFNTHRSHLNESPMEILFSTCSPIDQ
nr:hypothetical protein [Tanacetum cinerariifolium]